MNAYSVEHGSDFLTVISASPVFSDFFASNDKPNTGYFQFKERFVLLGFSTTGQEILAGDYRYVSQLTVKTNSSFPENYNYSGVGIAISLLFSKRTDVFATMIRNTL